MARQVSDRRTIVVTLGEHVWDDHQTCYLCGCSQSTILIPCLLDQYSDVAKRLPAHTTIRITSRSGQTLLTIDHPDITAERSHRRDVAPVQEGLALLRATLEYHCCLTTHVAMTGRRPADVANALRDALEEPSPYRLSNLVQEIQAYLLANPV